MTATREAGGHVAADTCDEVTDISVSYEVAEPGPPHRAADKHAK